MDGRNSNLSLPLEEHYLAEHAQGFGTRFGFAEILDSLRRGWRYPVYGCLIGLALALIYVMSASMPYKSSARILIDRSMNRYLQTSRIVDQPTFDENEVASQIYVLSSDNVIVPVVRSLNLTQDSEFVGSQAGVGGAISNIVGTLKDAIKRVIGWSSDTATDREAALERIAVEGVLKGLTVHREDVANVINVSFESRNPNKAATIANALAETYVANVLDGKLQSSRLVGQWLQDRLTELKNQAADADRALQDFKVANNLATEGGTTQDSELLATLKPQLASARLAATEAKERLDLIHRTDGEGILTVVGVDALLHGSRSGTINFALNNSDLLKLRTQYRELKEREADLKGRVGPTHAAMVKLQRQIANIGEAIRTEEHRIADIYANEYQVAKARENALAANITRLASQFGGGSQTQVRLRELESSAETLHSLYNTYLQKSKEIHAAQSEALPLDTARIITRAVPLLHRSSKKALAILAGSTMLGLFLGCGFVMGREWAADVFRTAKAVERISERKCISLPRIEPRSGPIGEFALEAPYSRFAEGLRDIKASIDAALPGPGCRVVGIVSAAPEEGKTTVAINLASQIAASSGARTLVIDSDLHLRNLSAELAPNAQKGIIDAMENPSQLRRIVVTRERSGLEILPCTIPTRIPNAAELLGSYAMARLLASARRNYDYIIIEIAPIMSVVDLKKVERFIDAFVFVVEWGRTRQSLVMDALSEAQMIHDRLVALALNKADPIALQQIESSNGSKYYLD